MRVSSSPSSSPETSCIVRKRSTPCPPRSNPSRRDSRAKPRSSTAIRVGQDLIPRYMTDQLHQTVLDLSTQYVNCWEDYSRFKTLYRILEGIDPAGVFQMGVGESCPRIHFCHPQLASCPSVGARITSRLRAGSRRCCDPDAR